MKTVQRDDGRLSLVAAPVALHPIRAHAQATMGDKSPKSMRKQADQKQSKADEDNRQKQAAVIAKQVIAKKK